MGWLTHLTEPYLLSRHSKLNFKWLFAGSMSPDIVFKMTFYLGWFPTEWHRLPPLGVTHTPIFGLALAAITYAILRLKKHTEAKLLAFSLLVGQLLHVFTDMMDSTGCMLLYPINAHLSSFGFWEYAAQKGLYMDFLTFYSSPIAWSLEIGTLLWCMYYWLDIGKMKSKNDIR